MIRFALTPSLVCLIGLLYVPDVVQADDTIRTSQRIRELEQGGAFTPAFKQAAHDLVDCNLAIAAAKKEQVDLEKKVPVLKTKVETTEAKVKQLQLELAQYNHTDDSDFPDLQKKMSDASLSLHDKLVAAQGYLWSFPMSTHQAEVAQMVAALQKQQADLDQKARDEAAAKAAAQADLMRRVETKQLSLDEWKEFLRYKSQEEVLRYLGKPQAVSPDGGYWTYTSIIVKDPATLSDAGLIITFTGTRVNHISAASLSQ